MNPIGGCYIYGHPMQPIGRKRHPHHYRLRSSVPREYDVRKCGYGGTHAKKAAPIVYPNKNKKPPASLQAADFQCRGDRIRTCDPLLPKQIR